MAFTSASGGAPTPPVAETSAEQPTVEVPAQHQMSEPLSETELTTQELRLALTFTGGVSLAVWMGGVAREVDLLVQASDARLDRRKRGLPVQTPQGPSYEGLLDLMDLAVSVDVISGTSAGGINAALLGLANSQRLDLSRLKDTWLTTGSLESLLRDPRQPQPTSLLQGDARLLAGLHEAIAAIRPPQPKRWARSKQEPVEPRQTDVFITTTLLSSETSRFVDDYGTEIVDANHHGLFHFDQDSMADPAADKALALAARSSASFPGAFEPSYVPIGSDADDSHPDMKDYSNTTRSHWAADGGLLVNRPIAPLLQTIFDRGADREVRRALLYIVPSSKLAPTKEPDLPTRPLGLGAALLRDVVATLNQSIAADLESIREHNDRVRSAADTRLRMASLGGRLGDGERLLDQSMWNNFRARQSQWLAEPLVAEIDRQLAILPGLPDSWTSTIGARTDEELRRTVGAELYAQWDDALPDGDNAATVGRSAYDSAKATVLRLLRLGFTLASERDDRLELARIAGRIKAALDDRRSADLRALVGDAMKEAARPRKSADLGTMATTLAKTYREQLAVKELPTAWAQLASVAEGAVDLLTRLTDQRPGMSVAEQGSLAQQRDDAAAELGVYLTFLNRTVPARGRPDWATQLLDLHIAVRSVLPVLVEVEQPVELIQVSADTRTLLAPDREAAAEKLTGLQFHHFGAFYKKTWRANDWMWGRLDGCGWLTHVLLDPRRMIALADNRTDRTTAPAAWFLSQLTEKLQIGEEPDADVVSSLDFLDHADRTIPTSLPELSLWVAKWLQAPIAEVELVDTADLMRTDADCKATGPAVAWLAAMNKAGRMPEGQGRSDAVVATLASCPISAETLQSESATPLFLRTVTQALAVTTAAATTMKKVPGPLRPTFATARSVTQTAYIATDKTHGMRGVTTVVGVSAVVAGVLAMLDNSTVLGLGGLVLFGVGALLLAGCVGRTLWRGVQAFLGLAVVLLAAAPWLPYISGNLFPWLHRTLFRWLRDTVLPRADLQFLPWLESHKWIWPVMVLVVLLSPFLALVTWSRHVGYFRLRAVHTYLRSRWISLLRRTSRERTAPLRAPAPALRDPYPGDREPAPAQEPISANP